VNFHSGSQSECSICFHSEDKAAVLNREIIRHNEVNSFLEMRPSASRSIASKSYFIGAYPSSFAEATPRRISSRRLSRDLPARLFGRDLYRWMRSSISTACINNPFACYRKIGVREHMVGKAIIVTGRVARNPVHSFQTIVPEDRRVGRCFGRERWNRISGIDRLVVDVDAVASHALGHVPERRAVDEVLGLIRLDADDLAADRLDAPFLVPGPDMDDVAEAM